MFYDPDVRAPAWAKSAFIYQIFPDRFRDGRSNNNPKTGDVRYDDPVLKLTWNTLPEGYCRNYTDGNTNCPWRFDTTPPADSPTKEQPRGRDYMGGDLKGVDQNLDYLRSLGVNTIYFNPIFDCGFEPRLRHPGLPPRSTPTSGRRRTGRTWSSTPTCSACGSCSTASSTTCRPTARPSTATTTTRYSAPVRA